jgi:GNAT superfamily N-acetyltransferase
LTLSGTDFLGAVAQIEKALDEVSMRDRVLARRKGRELDAVEIIDFQPGFARDFLRLNLEWIEKHFTLEPADKAILDDPQGRVIAGGGKIIFARLGRDIVGTAALIKHDDHTYELAKMAVEEKARGHQVGKKLALAAIEHALTLNAHRIVLFTNSTLIAANALYHQLGFVPSKNPHLQTSPYKRPSLALELDLRKVSQSHRRKRK